MRSKSLPISGSLFPMLLAALLAGCATKVPLPPMPPLRPLPPVTLTPPAPAASAASAPDSMGYQPAESLPIGGVPSGVQAPPAGALSAPSIVVAPYGEAVAARFPDPVVSYFTPAFEPGHVGFTSNAELHAFMRGLSGRAAKTTSIQFLTVGYSQQGQPIDALLFSRVPDPLATDAQNAARPTVLLTAQQRGDEPAGAEALLVIAQRLSGPELQGVLDQVNVIVVPRVNPDGAQAGRRTAANGVDIDRDHLLLRTPEARAVAQVLREYKPMVVVDSEEYPAAAGWRDKFGGYPSYDVLMQYAMTPNLPQFVTKASEEWFRRPMLAAFDREKLRSQWYFTTSPDASDRALSMGDISANNERNAAGLRNTVSLLVASRGSDLGALNLKRRVHAQVVAITSVLRSAASRSADLVKLRAYLDADVAAKVCQGDAVVSATEAASEYRVTMLDPSTGADMPMTVGWNSALEFDNERKRPRPCGYWLSSDAVDAVSALRSLGASVQQLQEPGVVQADSYAAGAPSRVGGPASPMTMNSALMDVPVGSYYVGLDQPLGSLVLAAMEPDSPSSYVRSGLVPRLDQMARVTLPPNLRLGSVP